MPKKISDEKRKQILNYALKCHNFSYVARKFGVSPSYVSKIVKEYRNNLLK